MPKISAVIVKFGKFNSVITRNLKILVELGVDVILVENSLNPDPPITVNKIKYIENFNINGLAGGLNAGIKAALRDRADFIFLLDQDTVLDPKLLQKYFFESARVLSDITVACCGPSFVDVKFGREHGFANYGFLKIKSKPLNKSRVPCLYLMTSGTMIRKDVFDLVGFMDESLFIDYIDIEWCLRARDIGYSIVGLSDIKFTHNVGDSVRKILWYEVPMHDKFRLYYQTRNLIYMMHKKHISLYWKLCESLYGIRRALFYILVSRDFFSVVCKGLRDGFKK